MDLAAFSKAIAGGIAGVILSEAARYGFKSDPATVTAVGVVLTAIVGYVVGHVVVYFAPKNKTT